MIRDFNARNLHVVVVEMRLRIPIGAPQERVLRAREKVY